MKSEVCFKNNFPSQDILVPPSEKSRRLLPWISLEMLAGSNVTALHSLLETLYQVAAAAEFYLP